MQKFVKKLPLYGSLWGECHGQQHNEKLVFIESYAMPDKAVKQKKSKAIKEPIKSLHFVKKRSFNFRSIICFADAFSLSEELHLFVTSRDVFRFFIPSDDSFIFKKSSTTLTFFFNLQNYAKRSEKSSGMMLSDLQLE